MLVAHGIGSPRSSSGQPQQQQVEPAPRPAPDCCTAWSNAGPAAWVPAATKMRGRKGTWHGYCYCHNRDPLRSGDPDRRCPEPTSAPTPATTSSSPRSARPCSTCSTPPCCWLPSRPSRCTPHPQATSCSPPKLSSLDRRLESARSEHNQLIDLCQAALIDMPTPQHPHRDHRTPAQDRARARLASPPSAPTWPGQRHRRGVQQFAARIRTVVHEFHDTQRRALLAAAHRRRTGHRPARKMRLRFPLTSHSETINPTAAYPGPTPANSHTTSVNRRPFAFPSWRSWGTLSGSISRRVIQVAP